MLMMLVSYEFCVIFITRHIAIASIYCGNKVNSWNGCQFIGCVSLAKFSSVVSYVRT